MVKIALKDGTFIGLRSICQTTGYIGPYLEPVSDAMAEIVRLATRRIPAAWAPPRVIVVGLVVNPDYSHWSLILGLRLVCDGCWEKAADAGAPPPYPHWQFRILGRFKGRR
jgi:hypothetical protein